MLFGPGKGLSPRSSLRLALPILAGTPRNAPIRLSPVITARRSIRRSGASLRFRLDPFVALRDALAPALTAASGDSSPERDHSPGSLPPQATLATPAALPRVRRRRLVASLASARLHSASPLRDGRSGRTVADDPAGFASRLVRAAQAPLGLAVLALVAPLARSSSSGATPCGAAS